MPEIKCPKCGEVFTVDESGYAAILNQVRDNEFQKAVREQAEHIEREKQNELALITNKAEMDKEKTTAALKEEILSLKAQLTNQAKDKDLEKANSVSGLEREIERLKAVIASNDKDKQIAVNTAETAKNNEIKNCENKIAELTAKLNAAEKDIIVREKNLKDNYEFQIQQKNAQIDFYKDLKTKMSTKMVGETLEQHCEIEFNKLRATGFQNAYFEKSH